MSMDGALKYAEDILGKGPKARLLIARLFPLDASLLPPGGASSRLVATVGLTLEAEVGSSISLYYPSMSPHFHLPSLRPLMTLGHS